jgi:hypothetical protein
MENVNCIEVLLYSLKIIMYIINLWNLAVNKYVNFNLISHNLWMWKLVFYSREDHRWRVFENKMLRIMFEPKRKEMTEGCRKLRNKDLIVLWVLTQEV